MKANIGDFVNMHSYLDKHLDKNVKEKQCEEIQFDALDALVLL